MVVVVRGEAEVASWPLPGADAADLSVVDALARLQLVARRHGCTVRVRNPSVELCDLLELVGLADLLPAAAGLVGREVVGQAEEREQSGVEEVVVADDPPA